ncbi:MAG: DMT family transporter [Leptonema illini]|uniref:DMT family transporter n=2 Tax=Leptonema illini TaxID=183 RepID=H2CGE9_9LEPT|nr:DMT family transporter [Leptonema illini]EHQ06864.1 protein of unknown function DUF606 [Leptonema illini DSM 21528]KAB2934222.1 MAG: DMT family transporter [Leptonema illini]
MEKLVYALITVGVGMAIGLHLAMNGRLGGEMQAVAGSPMKAAAAANLFFWLIGATLAAVYFFVFRPGSMTELFQAGSRPLFLAGAFGASIVFAVTFLIPERTGGAATGFLLLVTGQVLIGLLLSHFGWLGSPVDPISFKKIGGLALMLVGLILVVR